MPVAKLLSAPYVQLCESAPTTSSPGRTRPFSGSTVWQMPPCPTSKYHLIPISRENSRVRRPRVALAASLAGWKWSCVTATRSGSQIFSAPICSRMILPAGGMVRSWPIAKSTLASKRSPGRTLSRPAPRARIFSVMVMPIGAIQSLSLFATASPTSRVDRLPPRSRVHSPARMADSTAPSIALATSP